MEIKKTIINYFKNLENGNYNSLMKLFDNQAIVLSPLYGKRDAKSFYKELIEDSLKSKIRVVQIFVNENALSGAGNFIYEWVIKSGAKSSFEGVDLFEFNKEGKIKQVRIIYDTKGTRESFERMKSN